VVYHRPWLYEYGGIVPLRKLDRDALEELYLFCSCELREVFAWHLHFVFDPAHDLYLSRILSDALDLHG
jgi:hypothetical protein